MRKIFLTISVLALPLAACGQEEPAPPDPEPTQQVIEDPAPEPDGDSQPTDASDANGESEATSEDEAAKE